MNRRDFLKTAGLVTGLGALPRASENAAHGDEFPSVNQTGRSVSVASRCDVAVIGGSTCAVSAAAEAANRGASVFLAAPRPFLGEDMCSTLRLERNPAREFSTELARHLFGGERKTTPLRVKKVLDQTLVEAGVDFLLGAYATNVLRDSDGRLAGFLMANRAGRQAVTAKVVIDATDRAWFTRSAGLESRPWPGGKQMFERTLILDDRAGGARSDTRTVSVRMPTRSFADFAEAEQVARSETYVKGQLQASEFLFQVPPDPIVCRRGAADWTGQEQAKTGHFRPEGAERLFVLSGCADIPRDAARRLLRPAAMTKIAQDVGRSAAQIAARSDVPSTVRVPGKPADADAAGDVLEVLSGRRPVDTGDEMLECGARSAPVLGEYDVVIAGGGTSGAAAGIAAASRGASVMVIEYQGGLGGTGTLGMIGHPYHGRKAGFSKEVPFPDDDYTIEDKMEWYRREIRKEGGDIWFGGITCGAYQRGGRVRGVAVATPAGRGVIRAKTIIDSTGNADVAVAAGADSMYGSTEDGKIAMQGAGLPPRPLGASYVNTDYLFVDQSDMVDLWSTHVGARSGMGGSPFDVAPLVQTRERRRMIGDHTLRYLDQLSGRTYPDSIVYSSSDYDSHGYPNLPYFALIPHTKKTRNANHPAPGGACYTPYRCLLPRNVDGMLVTGLGISMKRDATAMVRMQLDMANQGYAAGCAAVMAAEQGISPRDIDVTRLQKHLVEVGNLPEEALEHGDSFPLSEEKVAGAVEDFVKADRDSACQALAILMSHPEKALPHVREAHDNSEGSARRQYAKLLGVWGERHVVPELIDELRDSKWDSKILQGAMAEYAHLPTPVDALVLALGYTRDKRALPAILAKTEELDKDVTLSHHRSVALALESIGHADAINPLSRLLNKPGMSGHAMTALETLHRQRSRRWREGALREIVLARALYRCGDNHGLACETLENYRGDLRALFARHASAVLEGRIGPPGRAE